MVTEAVFDAVQDILDGKRKKQPKLTKPIKSEFYLRKFLVCPHCGRAITGATSKGGSGGKYPYYFCPTTGKHIRIKADSLNSAFVDYISSLRPNQAIMQLYKEVLLDLRKDNARDIRTMIDAIDKDILAVNERMNKIEYKYLDGEIDNDAYNRMTMRQKSELKVLESKRELLETSNREKIEFDGKNYRTNGYNQVLDLIYQQTNELQGRKNKKLGTSCEVSNSVPGAGLEPAQPQWSKDFKSFVSTIPPSGR